MTATRYSGQAPFKDLLRALGLRDDETVSVCYARPGDELRPTLGTAADAPARAKPFTIPENLANVWFGVNPVRPDLPYGTRGDVDAVTRVACLWSDLDAKVGGMADLDGCWRVVNGLAAILRVQPVAVVFSGHGLQAYWRLADGDAAKAKPLIRRWGRLVRAVARDSGGDADNVYDLARIMRVPGSVNIKDQEHPVAAELLELDEDAEAVTLEDLDDALLNHGIGVEAGDGDDREVVSAPEEWTEGAGGCSYAAQMAAGWSEDLPNGRHPWLVSQATRLAAAFRLGCLTRAEYDDAVRALEARLRWLCSNHGVTRPVGRYEVAGALSWGVDRVATKSDEECWQELGDHKHAVGSDFWSQRESLQRIHDWAHARMASPWAVLGVTVARVLTTVPPHVVLPPIIHGPASLNFFVALVGKSGGGKGGSTSVAEEAVLTGEIYTREAGSGEGLVRQYAYRATKGDREVVRVRDSVLFEVPEVDHLTAVAGRNAATIMSMLRKAWSGELLGAAYAGADKDVPLEKHSYRLCMTLGVQPERAGKLFDETAGGTPQRFLFLPATDPDVARHPGPDPEPWEKAHPKHQDWRDPLLGRVVLPMPAVVVDEVQEANYQRMRGEGDALDGHALLLREKVTVALALLEGRRVPVDDDWRVAGQVMVKSDECRAEIQAALRSAGDQISVARGKSEGVRLAVAEETASERKVTAAVQALRSLLSADWVAASQLRRALRYEKRPLFDDALDLLVAVGDAEVEDVEGGHRVRSKR